MCLQTTSPSLPCKQLVKCMLSMAGIPSPLCNIPHTFSIFVRSPVQQYSSLSPEKLQCWLNNPPPEQHTMRCKVLGGESLKAIMLLSYTSVEAFSASIQGARLDLKILKGKLCGFLIQLCWMVPHTPQDKRKSVIVPYCCFRWILSTVCKRKQRCRDNV